MELQNFLPPINLIIWSLVFRALSFENYRWNLAIRRGMRGSSRWVPFFVTQTGFLGLLLSIGIIAAVFVWGGGWQPTLGLLAINFVGILVVTPITTAVFGGDSLFVWILATLAMYPAGYFLALEALALSG
jgi:hypothetical protein